VVPGTRHAHKFARFSITEEEFNEMLAAQGHACGICREPFEDGQLICIDHDHACCPVRPGERYSRSCGKCVRGLLCVKCNTWLGWMEKHGEMATAYLRGKEKPTVPAGAPGALGSALLRRAHPGVGVQRAAAVQQRAADTVESVSDP
jgi:hypothetical protein